MFKDLLSFLTPASPRAVAERVCRRASDAARHVPYYRDLVNQAGISPAFTSIEQCIERFPRTTSLQYRQAIQERGEAYVRDERFLGRPVIRLRTGGSSGVPVEMLRSPAEFARVHAAKTVFELMRAGVRPWDRISAFLPPWDMQGRRHPLQKLGIFRRFDVCFTDSPEQMVRTFQTNRVNVLFGRTSMMLAVVHYCRQAGIAHLPVKVLLPGSDFIAPSTRELLQDFFSPRQYGELYGTTETGIIALRLGGGDYEVEHRTVFFCLSNPTRHGEFTHGTMVVTNLAAETAPIVMMDLGDEVVCRDYDGLLDLRTTITEVRGRISEYVIDRRGERISASVIYSWLTPQRFIRQYRVEQEADGRVTLRAVLQDPATQRAELEHLAQKHFGDRLNYRVSVEDQIPFDPNGKTRVVVNKGYRPPPASANSPPSATGR